MPAVLHAMPLLSRCLFCQAWVESLLGLMISPLRRREDSLPWVWIVIFKRCARQCNKCCVCVKSLNLFKSLKWALCYLQISGLEMFLRLYEPSWLSRFAYGVAISLYGIHELLEGRNQGSGHHLITCFWKEQSGYFLHEAEPRGLRVISRWCT